MGASYLEVKNDFSPIGQVVVVRVLSPLVEPAMDLLRKLWSTWRQEVWSLTPQVPRIWAT